jgi:hypothetical protein
MIRFKRASGWSWLRWGGRANDRDKAVKKEEGIYLDDLANDPARMAEYFGKRNEAARLLL